MVAEPQKFPESPRQRQTRRARAEDAGAIASMVASADDLRQVSPLESFPLDRATVLHWIMQRDAGHVLEDRGEIIAYGELVPDKTDPGRVWIGHMIVHPRRRGLGVGQRLVHELIHTAERECDAREVAISAFADNTRALRCYESCGFVRVDRERVEGRPLVGMRLRFASRQKSPGPLVFTATGMIATALASAFLVRSAILVVPLFAMLLGARLSLGLAKERRDPWTQRVRAMAWALAIGLGAGVAGGLVFLIATGSTGLVPRLLLTCGSATLIWIALLAVVLRIRK